MPKITIRPEGFSFDIDEYTNILERAIQNKLNLPHGCKNGVCGACKCKVISGEIRIDDYNKSILSDKEKEQGYMLLCKAYPCSDIELFIPHILSNYPIKIVPTKILSILKVNNIAIIKTRIPPNQKFEFFAGQYVDVILSGKNRSYSIANAYTECGEIEIHVKYHEGGIFSEFVWDKLKVGDILRFKGPLGNFKLCKSDNPVIFVCTGTGIAPIKSILEEYSKNKSNKKMYLYWGNRILEDFYLFDLLATWKKELGLSIQLCLSQESKTGFNTGYVTDAIKSDFNDLSNFEIYACGNMKMIENVYELSTKQLRLDKERFYSDAFVPSVD